MSAVERLRFGVTCGLTVVGATPSRMDSPVFAARQAQHPRIPFSYAAEHVPVMIERAEQIRALADRYGVLIHSHAFRGSVAFGVEHFGAARMERLLGPDVLLAHCNGLLPDEVALLGAHRTGISVVPFTHENLLYGICPALALLRAGATVTIATDGTAPYASYDLLKDLSRALWAQWTAAGSEHALPAGKGLRMVTIDAARALGMDDTIGSLEAGKQADIIMLDLDRPHLTPAAHVPRLLAFYANGNDVHTVIVGGRILLRERTVLSVDEAAVLGFARDEIARAFERFPIDEYLATDAAFWDGPA